VSKIAYFIFFSGNYPIKNLTFQNNNDYKSLIFLLMMGRCFSQLFPAKKPIIGMLHLAGEDRQEKINRAIEEISIFEEEGISGVIVEDYHGSAEDIAYALEEISKRGTKLILGVNILRNPYRGFRMASVFGAKFVQFDSVQTPDIDMNHYNSMRDKYKDISVLGGVRFKYTHRTGNSLGYDLREARSRCEAIVTTGEGTGIETPIEKLREFRELLGDFPLIVGAGVNLHNVYEQLKITDGAIVGSFFKDNDTSGKIIKGRVKDLMSIVKSRFETA
jgi:predicted TIM-barrel enzyme